MVFADGTPLRTSVQFRQMTSGDAPDLRRHGRAGREFLLLRAHVKAMPYDRCHMAPLTMEPIALTHGKSTWHIYSAVTAFMGTLSSQGHHGISVHFYCFDRGLFSSLFAKLRSRHKLPYMQGNGGAHQTPGQVMAEASDWCVGVGCCLHDGQNALKWATRQHLPSDAADVSDLHIVVEAVRNSFADLMAFLGRHITANLGFDDTPFEESSVREFWLCLGVRGDYLDILCSLNLWWSGTELLVHSSWRDDPQLYEQVSKCILYLFQFRAFSDSRWATMGPSSRSQLDWIRSWRPSFEIEVRAIITSTATPSFRQHCVTTSSSRRWLASLLTPSWWGPWRMTGLLSAAKSCTKPWWRKLTGSSACRSSPGSA